MISVQMSFKVISAKLDLEPKVANRKLSVMMIPVPE